ncbi:NAD-dependent protein lipoamidase sirtuin-4, mitochondrial-like [Pollicipes pollicipes]|uniref:NAD-dependent protein lipoamidase sirtuin-4, mitochondrial-like n=1 Tax=Pollicipes pollicipes TaxID=41117 RepID=UPI001884C120|nr:NAD-dependent protein lipoamidase sirtuin-4, mitochondrial-like [Pollicipes pollicipes]XP_037077504.1 NAD-dependent protein lipoamidase sirtuin-4, mitochondrial-like [Pollicipes pollicipes]
MLSPLGPLSRHIFESSISTSLWLQSAYRAISFPPCVPASSAIIRPITSFVPQHEDVPSSELMAFGHELRRYARLTVITGAGVSTESGVPDYRSAGVGLYARSDRRPIQYRDFVTSEAARRRYWARNFAGWPRFSSVAPNAAHLALADWQRRGRLSALVTQNVDGLHVRADGGPLTELHGSAHRVRCLACPHTAGRHQFQRTLADGNPGLSATAIEMRPDGDVELSEEMERSFVVPACPSCGGMLIPDIVFFGDSVPRERVQHVRQHVEECDALLVVGSSLQVYSAYRFVLQAAELGRPVLILNIGPTRGDRHATLKLSARAGFVLPRLDV